MKRMYKSSVILPLVALVLFLFSGETASAFSDIRVRLFDEREMIAENYSDICQDKEGFLWVGTDAGLLRFDGGCCDRYLNDERDPRSISDTKIVSLLCDSKGRVWIGTVNGLNCYDRASDSFCRIVLPGMLLNGFITDMVEMSDGRILFVVSGIGLFTFDPAVLSAGNMLEAVRYKFDFDNERSINKLLGMGDNGFFFTTVNGDIWHLDKKGVRKQLAGIGSNVTRLSLENAGNLLVASQYEAFRLDLKTNRLTPLRLEGGKTIKFADIGSASGMNYFATAGDGIWECPAGGDVIRASSRFHCTAVNLSSTKIGSVFIDKVGNLWFGCNHKGLGMASGGKTVFSHRLLGELLRDESGAEITCMKAAPQCIVVGLNNGKVILLDSGNVVRKTLISQGNPVTSLAHTSDGGILVGVAREGIWRLDPKTASVSRILKPSAPYPGVVVSEAGNGAVVAAFSELGVVRYDPVSKEEKWFYPAGGSSQLSCSYYAGIRTTSDGKVWIGGYSGIACYDPESDGLMPIEQSPFLKGVVKDVCDYGGGILIATDKGLIKYDVRKGVLRQYTVSDGLPDNDVRTLCADTRGGIWVSTMKGLAFIGSRDEHIRSFGSRYGLSASSYLFSDIIPGSGRILVGDYESLTSFNPDSVEPGGFPGEIKITGIYLNGDLITEESLTGNRKIIEGSVMNPEILHLAYNDNAPVIRLSTMDFRDPSELCYQWQMDGEGDNWHTTARGESFIYLPPVGNGNHVLRIRGVENGSFSDVRQIRLDVKAPWYQSGTAYVAYTLFVLIIAGLLYKVIRNKREEELYEARIKDFMDISHELRAPVTLILNPVEALLKQEHSPETMTQLLTARRNGERVLNLLDQLLDLRNVEKGKLPFCISGAATGEGNAAPVTAQEMASASVETGNRSHRHRILLVERDDELSRYVKENLGNSYKVVTVANAEAALKEIGENLPDLIISDIDLDGPDGFALLRRIKANMSTHHIPVVLLSSANGADERTKVWKQGADGYLANPFSIAELEGMVFGLLETRTKLKGKFSGSQQGVDSIAAPTLKGIDEELMNKVNKYINDNISETSMNVDGLSEYVGLSRSQLHRRMKDIVGMAPSDYIRNVKLRKACEILSKDDVDIAQVAYSLGFNAQSHFSTLFKRFTGMTPSEYRNSINRKVQQEK